MKNSFKELYHHHIAPKMWTIRQTTKCGASVVGMASSKFGGEKLLEQVHLELRSCTEMEKRRWYLNTIPNMTRVNNLPVLKAGDLFKLDSSFLSKPRDSHKFPIGLRPGKIIAAFKAIQTDGYVIKFLVFKKINF